MWLCVSVRFLLRDRVETASLSALTDSSSSIHPDFKFGFGFFQGIPKNISINICSVGHCYSFNLFSSIILINKLILKDLILSRYFRFFFCFVFLTGQVRPFGQFLVQSGILQKYCDIFCPFLRSKVEISCVAVIVLRW